MEGGADGGTQTQNAPLCFVQPPSAWSEGWWEGGDQKEGGRGPGPMSGEWQVPLASSLPRRGEAKGRNFQFREFSGLILSW